MESGRFDRFTKGLGEERSRRGMLKLLGVATLGAVGVAGFRRGADAAPPPRVGVCHLTGNVNIPYAYIMVSPSTAAVLVGRGDTANPDFSSDVNHCGGCGHDCLDVPYNAYPVCDEGICGYACNDGFHDDGNGDCVSDSACQLYSFESATCFWMETYSGSFCWVPSGNDDFNSCMMLDSCAPGGGGQSGGGCYKWSTSSNTSIWPDANGWPV